jgi:hypothetical protein
MHADIHCPNADFIMHIDSDTVINEPLTPEMLFVGGKPLWLMTPWHALGGTEKKAWFHVMAKCLQEAPGHEFMRRQGALLPRWAYAAFRDCIQATHGITATDYIMNQPNSEFSEFNCIGFYLWLFHRESIHWQDTVKTPLPPARMEQFWSWGGQTPERRVQLEALLA